MDNWYVLEIGSFQDSPVAQRMQDIQRQFMTAFLAAPAGSGRALFWRENATTGKTEIFFTPQARDVAISLGAIECSKPVIGNGHIKSLAGDQNLKICFPGQEQQ